MILTVNEVHTQGERCQLAPPHTPHHPQIEIRKNTDSSETISNRAGYYKLDIPLKWTTVKMYTTSTSLSYDQFHAAKTEIYNICYVMGKKI